MVATLIRLKITLSANGFKRSTWQVIGTLIGLLYGLGLVGMVVAGLVAGGATGAVGDDVQTRLEVSVLLGSAAMLLWLAVPLFLTGRDSVMDPGQFVSFAVPRRRLVTGLVLCALISVGSVLTAFWLLGHILYWRSEPAAMLAATISAPLLLGLLSLVSQAVTTATSAWLDGRRFRDLMAVLALSLAMLIWPAVVVLQDTFGGFREALPSIAGVLALTPLGAGTALPADVATGNWGGLMLRMTILGLTAAAALLVIRAGLVRITEQPSAPRRRRRDAASGRIGLFAVFPARPWGAVAARALTYWLKDPRYGGSLVVVPGLVILAVVMYAQTGQAGFLHAVAPATAFMLGYAISADISYDNTAFSLHVTSGVRGISDRVGRAAALMSFALPATVIAAILPALAVGGAVEVGLRLSLSLGILLTAVGVSSVVSARFTYPVPAPGESPFKQPQGAMGRIFAVQVLSMLVIGLLMVPEIIGWGIWMFIDQPWLAGAVMVLALLKGAALLWAGIALGARIFDRSQPELFQQVVRM